MSDDCLPPQDRQAECSVLGSCLRYNPAIDDVALVLRQEAFYADAHQKIYAAIVHLHEHGQRVDTVALSDELKRRGQIDDVGGYGYLGELWAHVPTGANAAHYAAIVQDKATLRGLIHAATAILRTAYDQKGPANEVLEFAERSVLDIAGSGPAQEAVPLSTVAGEFCDYIDARESREGSNGVPIEFPDLDKLIPGWQPKELVIIGARPGTGKTAFGCQLARYAAIDCQVPVFFASLEQSRVELYGRMACGMARVDSQLVRRGKLTPEHKEAIADANSRLWAAPFYIDDQSGQSALRIGATARRLRRKHSIGLIVVDYLQLVAAEDRKAPRHEQVATIAERLRNLAKDLAVPVVALCQVNRNADARQKAGKPRLSDLRESGAIEQHADTVLLMHRQDTADGPAQANVVIELDVAKQRNGPIDGITLIFNRACTRFENYAWEPPESPLDTRRNGHAGRR